MPWQSTINEADWEGEGVVLYLRGEASGREIFLQFVRRPGVPLAAIGVLLLMQAVIMLWGLLEARGEAGWMAVVSLLFTRLLPGVILTVLGIGALGLGLFEIAAPNAFDEMGGGFLEMLYGVDK
jgi:hypothetical protein